jgi:tetratricopeptide (TPR) repeat protein
MKNIILTLFILVCFSQIAYAEHPMNEIPMYGGQHDPQVEENKEFSKDAAELGWQYFYSGDHDTAIKRFNQAWMFDRNSPQAFWGFGLIMGARSMQENTEENLKESINFLGKANELSKDNPKIMVDLAYSETMLGVFMKSEKKEGFQNHFDKARKLYEQSENIETGYPLLYSNWSVLEFYEESYLEAKEKLDKAKRLGFEPDPEYEKDLNEKLKK